MPLDVFPYQAEAADWLARRERAGLFDEMGIGKTATAIRALDLRRVKRGIIIPPAMARENWRSEFRKFAHFERRICKAMNIHDFVAWQRGHFDVLVTSYELATKWAAHIAKMGEIFDFLICDEGHYLKNDEAARSKAILGRSSDGVGGIAMWAVQSWILTGTPMANDPLDIYTFLRFCRAMPLTKGQFITRYFQSRAGTFSIRCTPKPEMIPELQALIANNSMRRTHAQVGLQLPPIFITTAVVDGDTHAIIDMLKQYPGLDKAIIDALEKGGLSFLDAQHVMTLRRLIGEAKAIPYAEMIYAELMGGLDKIVIYGIHINALLAIRDFLVRRDIRCVIVQGGTPERERVAAVENFQADANCRVFIGNIRAAGTAITVTASAALDMFESDWTPAGNAQPMKRVHRIGQTRRVRGRFIALARSFDEVVSRIVAEKTQSIMAVQGDNGIDYRPLATAQGVV